MSAFDNLFSQTPSGELTLNKKELRLHHTLGQVVKDMEKKDGLKHMGYIYLMADPKSAYYHLSEEQKDEQSRKHLNLFEGWKPTQVMVSAIQYYKEMVDLTATGKSFSAANKALFETGEDIQQLGEDITYLKILVRKKLKVIKAQETSSEPQEAEQLVLIREVTALSDEILSVQDKIKKFINDLPKLIDTVEKLAMKWANEEGQKRDVYGGGTLNNRE